MRFPSLTAEQQPVVELTERTLKTNAVAGSGKTTTLLAYAVRSMPEAHPTARHTSIEGTSFPISAPARIDG